jgi:hypothetical protein
MVPVLDSNNIPLMPCSEKRARLLMERGKAKPYWQKQVFCIKLLVEPSGRNYQDVALGIDPGSKREGYTVLTAKSVVLNVTTDTKDWVKDHVETRIMLRRTRRNRKTPYRKCRLNRLRNRKFIPPSTRVRWNTKLLMIQFLMSIIPITMINVEDIKAKTKEGKGRWNKSFSPLEVGKNWFYSELQKLGIKLKITQGFDTKVERDRRGFSKSKKKLDWIWEAHNVDSHVLAELSLGKEVMPFRGMWRMEYLEYHRRVLHKQNPGEGSIRSKYGSTVSFGKSRGSVVKYRGNLYYLGGNSKGMVSIHDISTGRRVNQNCKMSEVEVLYTNNRRVQFLPYLKVGVSLHNFR